MEAGRLTELVAGRLAEPAVRLAGVLEDPTDGSPLGPQRASAPESIERALATAYADWERGAWGGRSGADAWSGLPLEARAAALERFADELDARAAALAPLESLDTGVPIAVTRAIAASLGGTVRAAVAELRAAGDAAALPAGGRRVELLRRPWGPAALLAPWNAPAPVAIAKVANALAAGCPAILKPSEHAPHAAGAIAEAAVAADLPPGALQVVHGGPDVALALAGDPRVRMISLTGGLPAGRAIAAAAAPRMAALQLELSGRNPAIVAHDADVAAAAAALAAGATKLNGQWCEAPRRVLVAAALHDPLLDALHAELAALHAGAPLDDATRFGPLARTDHRDRVAGQVAALGGRATTTAPVPDHGAFLSPTLVTGVPAEAVREEIFGPVLTLQPVRDEAEALAAANAGGDGLAAYVFATDRERALRIGRALHAGEVRIGGTHMLDLAPGSEQSFWGTSGIGGHGARPALEAYRGARIVGEDDPALSM